MNEQWEAKCRRCSRCCYEKIEFEGEIYYTDVPCERLDTATGLCTVYRDREHARPGCVRLTPQVVTQGFLPADCPYVEGLAGYRAPKLWDEEGEEAS